MLRLHKFLPALIAAFLVTTVSAVAEEEKGWVSLFDGKSLDGWKAAENPKAFVSRRPDRRER